MKPWSYSNEHLPPSQAELIVARDLTKDINFGNFSGMTLRGENFRNITFTSCSFIGTTFINCDFDNVRFAYCDLQGADFRFSVIRNITARGCTLRGIRFTSVETHDIGPEHPFAIASSILPEGDIIGYKKVQDDKIVQAAHPQGRKRLNAIGHRSVAHPTPVS